MIELFDAERLAPRRDHSLALCAVVLALGVGALSVYAYALQQRLRDAEAQRVVLQTQLKNAQPKLALNPALVADMQRQAEALEVQIKRTSAAEPNTSGEALRPSTWLDRLGTLATHDVSLAKVEIESDGSARIEGLATTPAAVSAFVQAFAAQNRQAPAPRAIEVRQEKAMAPYLRFVMRANPPRVAPQNPPPAAATAVEASASAAAPNPLQVAQTR